MNKALLAAAVGESATGVALLFVPSLVGELLLGEALAGAAVVTARVGGLALIGLGIACWRNSPLAGMLTYGMTVALYLAYLGLTGGATGILLWPAVFLHAIQSILLGRAWLAT
ncbi:hypothetical protein [Rhizobium sp. RAF56]|uniref:hypothetical protein n=1 Tax=Rhizobium sp. RAF56 TaxID=3233062 RepID=UPI003F952FEC